MHEQVVILMTHPIAWEACHGFQHGHPGGVPGPDPGRDRQQDQRAPDQRRGHERQAVEAQGDTGGDVDPEPPGAHHGGEEEDAEHHVLCK